MLVMEKEDLKKLLGSRFAPPSGMPLEFTQLLDKLVDVPTTHATPDKRTERSATGESYEGIQPRELRYCRA